MSRHARLTFELLVRWRRTRDVALLLELARRGDPRLAAWWDSDEVSDDEARSVAHRELKRSVAYAFTRSDEEARRHMAGTFCGAN